ncbi:Ephrin_rec_like domain-containing protein [Durusdinium trenchii]|uniref:Ephrin_rec_like domain-containing protein n=1 Tax=Durusdinium trenchii TaxID=1381693 RepID=A0ABP0KPM8_9DINO
MGPLVATLWSAWLWLAARAAAPCFDDAIPAASRKNVTNSHGESYPLGIHVGGWTAAVILSSVADVIIREKMGYHTSQAFGSGTVEQFFAMAGCQTPADIEDRGCAKRKIVHHLSLEGWTDGYAATWNQIQQDYPDTAPQNLGGTGYAGLSSDYITQEVQERALSDSGLSLEFYRSYNRSWHDAGQYFDRISQVNTSLLAPCNQSRLMVSEAMLHYANLTGDWDGVENVSGKVIGKCFQGHFWFAPACRQNASACYMHLTAGSGWGWEHTMQKSAKYLRLVMKCPAKGQIIRFQSDCFRRSRCAYDLVVLWEFHEDSKGAGILLQLDADCVSLGQGVAHV